MREMGEIFNAMKKSKKERHLKNHLINTKILIESGITYMVPTVECCCFRRSLGSLKDADFYPSTGRWRDFDYKGPKKYQTKSGGAKAFLKWLNK